MKVYGIRRMIGHCEDCRVLRRNGNVVLICSRNPRHERI